MNGSKKHSEQPARILSWNVNGLRACTRKGFVPWLHGTSADVVAVQEVRAREEQLTEDVRRPHDWHAHFVAAERPGYSGVGLFSRQPPDNVETALDIPEFDVEGRLQIATFGALTVCNGYFPNGSGPNRDHSRIPYKLRFYRRLFEVLESQRAAGDRILVMGDFNTAHEDIDLARPKQNAKTSGFTPAEREELDRWLRSGWTDTFRRFNTEPAFYSWWSQQKRVRERNVGWRIDMILASPGVEPFLRYGFIQPWVPGSDHCPVGVDLDWAAFEP